MELQAIMPNQEGSQREPQRFRSDLEPAVVSQGAVSDAGGSENEEVGSETSNEASQDADDAGDDGVSEESDDSGPDYVEGESEDDEGESEDDEDESENGEGGSEYDEGESDADERALWPSWNLSSRVLKNTRDLAWIPHAQERSLVWPPMLLVCTNGLNDVKDAALSNVRAFLAEKGLQAEAANLTENVCWEGNMSYHLLVLPPTGIAFAAAKAVDEFYQYSEDADDLENPVCYYPSLRDMVDIRNARIPASSRRFVQKLCYHGMAIDEWKDLEVDLLLDDGICVGRGVCRTHETNDYVSGRLRTSHVRVQVLDVVDNWIPLDWKGSIRQWNTKNVLYNGVSLFDRLWQHSGKNPPGLSYCEDIEPDISRIQHGELKDQPLTTVQHGSIVGPLFSNCKVEMESACLPAECSKICLDALLEIENSSKTSPDKDFGERYSDGLSFKKKLQKDEETRMKQMLDSLSNASTRKVLMKHLGTANHFGLAGDVVQRLRTLQKLNESGTDSVLICTMIKAAEEMELGTLRSIREHVQLEKQRENVLVDMERQGMETILKLREVQHRSLMETLAKIEAGQISKFEEFVSHKFKLMNGVHETKKETESVVGWLSKHISKATHEVQRTHMMEKKQWKDKMAKSEEEAVKSKAKSQAARREAEELARKTKEWDDQVSKLEEQVAKSEAELQQREDQLKQLLAEQKRAFQFSRELLDEQKKAFQLSRQQLDEVERAFQGLRQQLDEQRFENVELQLAKQKLEVEQNDAIVSCAICFEKLEETTSKKRNRDNVVLRKRSCFIPCMHANMCSKCADETWERHKRCPVCNTPCPTKPKPIFM